MIKQFDIIGAAYAELISISLYNFIRFEFLRRRFNMQPFTAKTIQSILLFSIAFASSFIYLKALMVGWEWFLQQQYSLFKLYSSLYGEINA
jgi:hypothetical protein